jgi:hypothetical protein
MILAAPPSALFGGWDLRRSFRVNLCFTTCFTIDGRWRRFASAVSRVNLGSHVTARHGGPAVILSAAKNLCILDALSISGIFSL